MVKQKRRGLKVVERLRRSLEDVMFDTRGCGVEKCRWDLESCQ
jgi:hypothetical protein